MQRKEPVKVLCIHDLACFGRAGLAAVLPVLSAMGVQPVALPTVLLSSHTGGLGEPAREDCARFGMAALEQYAALGVQFDCIDVGYLGSAAQGALASRAFSLWPKALKVVDPVLGDHGRLYTGVSKEWVETVRGLCGGADLILPNHTEACCLLGRPLPAGEDTTVDAQEAGELAAALTSLAPQVVVTGLPMGNYVGCAGAGKSRFIVKKLRQPRGFPGTGDLFGAVVAGCILRGNAMEPAVDAAAEFVALAMQGTAPEADPRFGTWFEPLLPRLRSV